MSVLGAVVYILQATCMYSHTYRVYAVGLTVTAEVAGLACLQGYAPLADSR